MYNLYNLYENYSEGRQHMLNISCHDITKELIKQAPTFYKLLRVIMIKDRSVVSKVFSTVEF